MNFHRPKAVAWLLVLTTTCLLLHLIQHNWALHAHLNLLLRGYVFCRLVTPDREQLVALPTNELVSKLVYKGHACIGYLDGDGHLVTTTDNAADWDERCARDMVITVALFYAKLLVAAAAGIVSLRLLYRSRWTLKRKPS